MDGRSAIKLTEELCPDVVLIEYELPFVGGNGGVDATKSIRRVNPNIQVIRMSLKAGEAIRRAMLDAGAAAYFTKGHPLRDLLALIRHVYAAKRN